MAGGALQRKECAAQPVDGARPRLAAPNDNGDSAPRRDHMVDVIFQNSGGLFVGHVISGTAQFPETRLAMSHQGAWRRGHEYPAATLFAQHGDASITVNVFIEVVVPCAASRAPNSDHFYVAEKRGGGWHCAQRVCKDQGEAGSTGCAEPPKPSTFWLCFATIEFRNTRGREEYAWHRGGAEPCSTMQHLRTTRSGWARPSTLIRKETDAKR